MSDDVATLGIVVDASQTTDAAAKLDALAATGTKTQASLDGTTYSAKQLATALAATGNDLTKATALLDANGAAASRSATAMAAAATTTATAATALNGAALTMAQSFAGLGSSAVQAAAEIGASAEAGAAAEVEAAAVTVAAHGAVVGSSTVVRESLVLLREASVGNFTRMAGSASILANALGILRTVIVPLGAAAIVLGAVFEAATNQINSGVQGSGDLTKNMGLTADQLDRVTDKYVTLKDTAEATFQVLGADLLAALGGDELKKGWQDTWNFIAQVVTDTFAGIVGTVVGGVRTIEEAWKVMPTVLGGEGSAAGINFSKAFQSGIDDTTNNLNKFYADVANKAREDARSNITDEAGKAKSQGGSATDGTLDSIDNQIDKIQDQANAQKQLNDAITDDNLLVSQATTLQKFYGQVAGDIVKIENDNKASVVDKTNAIFAIIKAYSEYNEELTHWNALQSQQTQDEQEGILALRVDLIGKSSIATAAAVAEQQAWNDAVKKGYNDADAQAFVQGQVNIATNTVLLAQKQKAYNDELDYSKNAMAELDSSTQRAAQSISSSFGNVGKAIGSMATALTSYTAKQADFAKTQHDLDLAGNTDASAQLLLTQKQQDASDALISSELDGVKNLFGQKTGMYAALNAAETAYNAIILANNIAQIAANIPLTISNIAAGASKMFAELGPFGFAAVAAMMAVMVAVGFGGGGASAPTVDDGLNGGATAKANQAAQGSGSVLGDATAQSESITNSLTQLEKDSNANLEYSNQMVISLKAIQDSIGKVAASLAQQLTAGGSLSTDNLGLGSSSDGGFLGLFASSTTKVLQDQGVQIAAQSIANIIAQGIQGNTFQTTQTTETNSGFFGLFGGSSTSTNTTNAALPSDVAQNISDVIASLSQTVVSAASKLGISGAQAVVDSFVVNIGKISLVGLTGSQITDALNAVFSEVGDNIAAAVAPQVTALAQVGEGALETLSRLVSEYTAVDDVMKTIGSNFATVGVDSLAARDNLVQLSGGLDQFTSQAQFFADNFLTSAQALAPIQKAVTDEMTALGYAGVTTKEQFAALVQGIDVSTTAGAELYATLQNVAPAFAKVADAVSGLLSQQTDLEVTLLQDQGNAVGATALQREKELDALDDSLKPLQLAIYAQEDLNDANTNLASAQQELTDAYQAQNAAVAATAAQIANYNQSLTAFRATLNGDSSNPLATYATARATFSSTATAAEGGDVTAIGNLQNVAQAFLTASAANSATATQNQADINAVKVALDSVIETTQTSLDTSGADAVAKAQADIVAAQQAQAVAAQKVAAQMDLLTQVNNDVAANTKKLADIFAQVSQGNPYLLTKAAA